MFVKPMTNIDLTVVRDGRSALRDLRLGRRYRTLDAACVDRLEARLQAAFDEIARIIDESPDPTRAHLYAIDGGARG